MIQASSHHLARRLTIFISALWIGGGASLAYASCQTEYCRYRLAQSMLDRESELLSQLEQEPTDIAALQQLLHSLESKAAFQTQASRWRERYHFEAEALLVDPEVESRAARELERWRRIALEVRPSAELCRRSMAEGSERVLDDLRRKAAEQPDGLGAALCLQQALAGLGRTDEAADHADAYLADHLDDPRAWANALSIQPDEAPGGRQQQLLEHRAERLPTLAHRLELLDYYDRHGLRDLRDSLLAAIESEEIPLSEARNVCWRLDQRNRQNDARQACERRLFHRLAVVEGAEDVRQELRFSLLAYARNQKDWAAIERLLVDWPRPHLLNAWGTLVDWLPDTACPRLITGADQMRAWVPESSFDSAYYPAERLASMFQACSRDDLALQVVNPLLPSPAGDIESALKALRTRHSRETLKKKQGLPGYSLDHLSSAGSPLPLDERRAAAQRWLDLSLDNARPVVVPVRRLIEVYEQSKVFDQVVEQIRRLADAHPEDAEIPLALGYAALRRQSVELVIEMVELVEQSPFANTRQRAEASYLRGRVARLQGYSEQAVELLQQYFALRQRFDPCGPCDGGLMALFIETGNFTGLRQYLTVRHQAFKEFSRRHFDEDMSGNDRYSLIQRRRVLPISEEAALNFWVREVGDNSCDPSSTLIQFEVEPGLTEEPNALCLLLNNGFEADDWLGKYEHEVFKLAAALTKTG